MLNRYSFVTTPAEVQKQFGILLNHDLRYSYNIGPTHQSYLITNEDPAHLQYFYWGLIPSTAPSAKNNGKLINARRENVSTTPSFRMPLRRKRCLVLADSFYLWTGGLEPRPYRVVRKDGALIAMAGVWDSWTNYESVVNSFSIITSPANREISSINNRMPVVYSTRDMQQAWLANQPLSDIHRLLDYRENDLFDIYRISEKINGLRYDQADLHDEELVPPKHL